MNIRSTSTLATNKFEAEINSVLVWFDSRDPVQDHLACDVSDLVTRHPTRGDRGRQARALRSCVDRPRRIVRGSQLAQGHDATLLSQ
jgi:hypothetical protein